MADRPRRGDDDVSILDDIAYLCIDDQAHSLFGGCRPQQREVPGLAGTFDRASAQFERDRLARERWSDVRDARRAIRGGHDGVGS